MLLAAHERRGKLDGRVAPVVGAADQARLEQGRCQEAVQEVLGFLSAEGLARSLVLYQFDGIKISVPSEVAHYRDVQQRSQGSPESGFMGPDVAQDPLLLEQADVGQGHRRRHGMAPEGDAVSETSATVQERFDQPVVGQ